MWLAVADRLFYSIAGEQVARQVHRRFQLLDGGTVSLCGESIGPS
jgi:hypothetical protein